LFNILQVFFFSHFLTEWNMLIFLPFRAIGTKLLEMLLKKISEIVH